MEFESWLGNLSSAPLLAAHKLRRQGGRLFGVWTWCDSEGRTMAELEMDRPREIGGGSMDGAAGRMDPSPEKYRAKRKLRKPPMGINEPPMEESDEGSLPAEAEAEERPGRMMVEVTDSDVDVARKLRELEESEASKPIAHWTGLPPGKERDAVLASSRARRQADWDACRAFVGLEDEVERTKAESSRMAMIAAEFAIVLRNLKSNPPRHVTDAARSLFRHALTGVG